MFKKSTKATKIEVFESDSSSHPDEEDEDLDAESGE